VSETQDPKQNGNGSEPTAEPAAPAVEVAPPAPPEPSELDKAKAEVARLKDQLLRTAAEFDNFRKRARRELEDARSRGRDETLSEILPVFDNLMRAAQAATSATDVAAIQSGIQLVLGQLDGALSRIGVTPIEAVGMPFDPTRHDAIQQLERADVAPGTVVEEVQRGYLNGERLVRAALVVVARAPAPPAPSAPEEAGGPPKTGEEPS
jgi:molecular chaperone GrpE